MCFWQEARFIIRSLRSTLVSIAQRLATVLLPSEPPFELAFPRVALRIHLAPSGLSLSLSLPPPVNCSPPPSGMASVKGLATNEVHHPCCPA